MKRYVFNRILRSILSIFLVTTIVYGIIFTMVPRRAIFQEDPNYSKLKGKPDELAEYTNTAFRRMGYIEYYNSKQLIDHVREEYPEATVEDTETLQKWADENDWDLQEFQISGNYYATKEIPLWRRVGRFYGNMFELDHPWKIKDPDNPDLKRSLKIQKDELVGWALVGSGTEYKYQIYFNSQFPYIHQNFLHMNLGYSYPTFAGQNVIDVMTDGQGKADSKETKFSNGKVSRSSIDVYSRRYQQTKNVSDRDKNFFDDNYVVTKSNHRDPSMVGISLRMGLVGVILTYLISIPSAVLMARFKGKFVDRFGIGIVTVLISVPSLAFIYFFRFIGSRLLNLPDSFPTLGAQNIRSYVLPTVILGLLSVSGLVIWIRRYMIDQQSSDYVKFAKAKGLSSGEISRKHIFKNASIPIVNQIPGMVIGAITGATITETVFAAPGMGKMLPDSISAHNNTLVIGIVFFFTIIAVFSNLFGDLLMVQVDPRINLSDKGE
ncbi:MAG TPA: ABC transporter permease [Candidatus Tetragenococcus pullicola]|nr:ABC transporter permease [Candidatus Tetragenococcus pullicola]